MVGFAIPEVNKNGKPLLMNGLFFTYEGGGICSGIEFPGISTWTPTFGC